MDPTIVHAWYRNIYEFINFQDEHCQVGYTGDPYVGCVDIDECNVEELNTCAGGMNPNGIDIDVFGDGHFYGPHYIGPVDADGYTQVKLVDTLPKILT